ncbi:MAG TPA: hypothetical protein VEB59_14305 [Gemmatimonadales bacterium]|nr:hypothetical protein [Gemmatimonadales bacterium]
MTAFRLTSATDSSAAVEYFNGFHDGFVRELTLRSHDRFEARGAQEVSGRLDLEIVFAHYNYRSGEPPADQLVRARFVRVSALVADFRLTQGAWFIDRLEIDAGGEGGLVARLFQQRLVDGAWGSGEELRFTFASGEMEEL